MRNVCDLAQCSRQQTDRSLIYSLTPPDGSRASFQTQLYLFMLCFSTCEPLPRWFKLCLHHEADRAVVITACSLDLGHLISFVTTEAQIEAGQVCMIWNQSIESEK